MFVNIPSEYDGDNGCQDIRKNMICSIKQRNQFSSTKRTKKGENSSSATSHKKCVLRGIFSLSIPLIRISTNKTQNVFSLADSVSFFYTS